jgi:hypothetical protein
MLEIRRRDFIAGLGGAAAWPLAATAQQGNRVRRIGVLLPGDGNDPVLKTWVSAFTQALAGLGWTEGRNVRMDLRWYGDDINRIRAPAQELVALQPDIILASNTPATAAVQRETQTIPIVLIGVTDPVASGLVQRLNQPGGNITGFALFETTLGGKWLQLLTEIAPGLKRAAIMFNPDTAPPVSVLMPSFEAAARGPKPVDRIPLCREPSAACARAGGRPDSTLPPSILLRADEAIEERGGCPGSHRREKRYDALQERFALGVGGAGYERRRHVRAIR